MVSFWCKGLHPSNTLCIWLLADAPINVKYVSGHYFLFIYICFKLKSYMQHCSFYGRNIARLARLIL